ncbi:hypothetical protein BJ508DRAFT_58035 [Ascobolus immersus RN42]|uniref:Uncharacterized protein n=1 Tax=Ascobolus immersus RN42 TaxID=1160509 RepID=A0A3N4HKH2_ASCIM|nr:hypothetical protein BJ508DRAFT_58035 [Ascobolus immersus RN42]
MMFVSSVGSLLSQLLTLQTHLLLMPTGYGSGSLAAASTPGHQGSLGRYHDPGDSWTYREVLALQLLPEADFAASKDLFQHMAPILDKPAMARNDISSQREDSSTVRSRTFNEKITHSTDSNSKTMSSESSLDTQPGFCPTVPFSRPLACHGSIDDNLMVGGEAPELLVYIPKRVYAHKAIHRNSKPASHLDDLPTGPPIIENYIPLSVWNQPSLNNRREKSTFSRYRPQRNRRRLDSWEDIRLLRRAPGEEKNNTRKKQFESLHSIIWQTLLLLVVFSTPDRKPPPLKPKDPSNPLPHSSDPPLEISEGLTSTQQSYWNIHNQPLPAGLYRVNKESPEPNYQNQPSKDYQTTTTTTRTLPLGPINLTATNFSPFRPPTSKQTLSTPFSKNPSKWMNFSISHLPQPLPARSKTNTITRIPNSIHKWAIIRPPAIFS